MGDRDGGGADSRRWLRRSAVIAAVLAVCAGGAYIYIFNPVGTDVYPKCPFHTLTGLHCPGCGTVRALHQLLHGNVLAAMRFNPLAVVLLPPVAYGMLSIGLQFVGLKPLPSKFIPAFWIWTLLAVILLYWVLRNIPCQPFTLLAPH
jgi:Protein of unknown function (DUF2752)